MSQDVTQSDDSKQIMRAQLRENFLKKLISLENKKCNLSLYENTNVSGIFHGINVEMQEILISDLVTPTKVIPHAIIRVGDTIAIEFNDDKEKYK